ncbi:glycoside hydrolase domain-containing protein [Actinokineospora cianjurensis]|uniref:Peptidoglycan hydrolase-like protein with peptidoglycan-binding domain n=1 Tax=Actinokineospora cianjurensis TaxID=585224 RepID=A0A421BBR0_9PSEU|nr:glycoside hydrolase domain-containing protein [Actinokineospora cianjurensis]RLK61783.1 peptidoglycan hydrolase-like protein with peptidoglycan-binding domain [Actinokineospora cianjurensis]
MADIKVLEAQQWVNATYGAVPGYVRCPEDGRTAWSTMFSLTRALQHELGITALSDSFGPTTLSLLTQRGNVGPGYSKPNIVRIVQHALFCKGYWGGTVNGVYGQQTLTAVTQLKSDMGLGGDGTVPPKVFKALLTMDAYVLLSGGDEQVRAIQKWLNSRYLAKSTFFVIPCDGHYSRDVQKALMRALQYEFGVPEDQATGNFGPTTQDGLRAHPVSQGQSGVFVQLFSAACVFNGPVPDDTIPGNNSLPVRAVFKSAFDADLKRFVEFFQRFSSLPATGYGDYPTWAQLLVSSGDDTRPATACDTRFHISVTRAQALRAAGYTVVGRYLDEDANSTLDKELQPGELEAIFAGGLRVFPISQYNARLLGDFTYDQGYQHALRAHARAAGYKFNRGAVIYFAVDYDATDEQIDSNILPYFRGVQAGLASQGKWYIAGVYGSRNVCTRVTDEAYARFSFVSGISWGFSGNLGFPLPANWSFNQIKEFSFVAGADRFDLDRVVHRAGSDPGVGPEGVGGQQSPVDTYLRYVDDLYATAVRYGKGDPNLRVAEFLRYPTYVDLYSGWQNLIGDVDRDWIAYASTKGPARVNRYADPGYGVDIGVDHFGATVNAVLLRGTGAGTTADRGDFGGWGGDLATFYGEWRANGTQYASGYAFCAERLAKITVCSSFPFNDLVEDVDGYLVGTAVLAGTPINTAVRDHLTGGCLSRFRRFVDLRHGGRADHVVATARSLLGNAGDTELAALRTAAIKKTGGWDALLPGHMPDSKLDPFLQGYADTLLGLVGQENARRARLS